ncbi:MULTISPECIES: T9SS sorting signal type C domain-containing protein [unclassified Flavobacterium]|uniref:T9SS sorting signal type C domain-containing protein n=1 Tax=unclassified Flavobacterium TaxID=196869 RepID=UPI0009FB68E2|nr:MULTISPECIES: T9SS sorting signal type C domain-containing protein [unclassified Flavobacterium]
MMKTLLLFLFLPFFGIAQTVDLASWALTSDGNITTKQSYVQSGTFTSDQNPIAYGSTGALVTGWNNPDFEHYRYIEVSITPTTNNVIWISNLVFQQASIPNGGTPGPSTYIAKYYVSQNGTVPGTYDFYNDASNLVTEESISGNPSKSIKINESLNSNQKLIIRLYTKGTDYNNIKWQILANTLKFTGKLMGPLAGTYTIGSGAAADFSTLTSAINTLNNVGVSAAVTFLLDNTTYTRATNEVFPLNINPYFNNTLYKVTFKPNTGKTVSIESTNLPASTSTPAVFKLNGVDNVIFDGSNNGTASKNLTIYNNNPINPKKSVIWIASENGTNGALNNEIKNLILRQNYRDDDLSVGVFGGGTSSVGSDAEAANSNNLVQNVTFTKVGQAVYVAGNATTLSTGWKVQNNIIGGTTVADKPFLGVYLNNAKDYEISGNTINGVQKNTNSYSPMHSGIIILGTSNGQIFSNTIRDVSSGVSNGYCAGIYIDKGINTIYSNTIATIATTANNVETSGISINGGTNTIYANAISAISASKDVNGIALNAGTSHVIYGNTLSAISSVDEKANGLYINNNTNTVYNNIISDVYSKKASSSINYNSGSGGKIYYNTLVMNSVSAVTNSACLTIAAGSSIGIKNNIFYNSQTTGTQYLINSSTDHTAITEFNNNNYYLASTGALSNKLSSGTYTTLAAWKAVAAAKEQSSIIVEPKFISTTDFHLVQNTTNSGIHEKGTPITGFTTDIDNETRSTTAPDMGADEIIICGQGDQTTFGVDSWIGYVYKWTNAAPNLAFNAAAASATNVFIGNVTEPAIFDRNIGNSTVRGVVTNICGTAPADNYFVRYKMRTTTAAGTYNISIGSDDGVRLYIDGNLVLSRWNDHSFIVDAALYTLTAGSHEFILEYYENIGSARTAFSYGLIKGDNVNLPYGDNVWNVYGFTKNNFDLTQTAYAGTYVDSSLNINTTTSWAADRSPSSATAWQGAPIPVDNFTVTYKRQGFPCGNYQLQVVNCDDDMRIYVDEVLEYTAGQNIGAPVLVKTGQIYSLNKNSKIEVQLREDAGDAKMALNLIAIPTIYDGSSTPASGSAITVSANTMLNSDLEVCSCTISPGVTLTVPTNRTLTVQETTIVGAGGKLLIKNGGSLLQKSTDANAYQGAANSFELERTTAPIRRYDFTYWSTPVTTTPGVTLHDLSPTTLADKYYSYNPTTGWTINYNGTLVMTPGQGYIVRSPQEYDINSTAVYQASFKGVPNNGNITVTPTATKWNLIGNPYPSAISANQLINDTGVGALYFWTHNSPPNGTVAGDAKYNYTAADYAVYSLTGSVVTTSGAAAPTGNIAAGQGFFFKATTGNNIVFTNNMRIPGNNTQFFKTSAKAAVETNRIWLNFTNAEGAFKQALIGYIDGATNSWDQSYDAATLNGNTYADFYSINDAKKLTIQGRAVPFEDTDVISLGYKTAIAGEFTISIDHVDGLFEGQKVYLEDKVTNTIQDLKAGIYTFTSEIGTFTDRFQLRYTNKTLGTGDFENVKDGLLVSVKDKAIKATSSKENIKEVNIYDITGKLVYSKNKIGVTELSISNLQSSDQVLLVKVTLENDFTTTRKIIFK